MHRAASRIVAPHEPHELDPLVEADRWEIDMQTLVSIVMACVMRLPCLHDPFEQCQGETCHAEVRRHH